MQRVIAVRTPTGAAVESSTQEEPISTRRQKVIKFIKDSKEQQKWFREFGETQIFDLNEKEELTNFVKSCLQAIAEKNLLNLTEILHNDEVAFYDYMQDAFEEAATKIGDKIIQESKNTTHIECSAILVPFFDFECEKETSTVAFKVCKSGYPAFFISSNCDIFQTWDKYLDDAVTNEALICVPRDGYYTEDNPVVDFFQCNWNNASHSQSTQLENISKITSDPVFQKLVSFALDNILQMFSNEDSHWLYHAMVYLKNGFNSVDFKKVIEELRKDIENKNITMIIVKCVKMVLSVVAIIANFSLFPYANVFKSFCLVGQVICDYLIHKIIAKRN